LVRTERANGISPLVGEGNAATPGTGADVRRCTLEVSVLGHVDTPRSSLFKPFKVSGFHTGRSNRNIAGFGSDDKSIGAGLRGPYGGDLFEGSNNAVQRMASPDISGHNPSGSSNDTDSQKSCQQGREEDLSLHFE